MKAQKESERLSLVQKTYERTFSKFGLDFHVVLVDKAPDKYEWQDDWSFSGFEAYIETSGCKAKVQIKYTPRYGVGYYIVDNGLKSVCPYKTTADVLASDKDEMEIPLKDDTAEELYAIEQKAVEGRLTMSANRKHAWEVLQGSQKIETRKDSNINRETVWVTKDVRVGALLSLIDVAHMFVKPLTNNSCSQYDLQFALYPEYVEQLGESFTFADAYKLVQKKLTSEITKEERKVKAGLEQLSHV